ncbi:DUF4124 domain-containing protein [Lysobacter koreensis]|uniref:DUF4124 domain-containing protein n=1 Tax=Lysobacter koreensis TaxID=266122 RepID=A0ABW2YQK7_9GAMM
MPRAHARCLLAAALFAVAMPATIIGAQAAQVTIYRCTDGNGRLTLRDTPCRKGEQQQTRQMLRPTDPPRRPAPAAVSAPARAPAAPATTRVIVVQAPRPLYECMAPDGTRYTNDSGEGTPRWMPGWSYGDAYGGPGWIGRDRFDRFDRGGLQARIGGRIDNGRFDVRIGEPMRRPPFDRPGRPAPPLLVPVYPAGSWVRDPCEPLPAQEVCSRLSDRRYELDRRYNSALQSERAQITVEQRGIDARLASDCRSDY